MRVFSGRKGQGAAWQRRWVAWPFGVLLLLLGFLDGLLGALLVSVVVDDIKRRGPKQSPEPLGKGKLDRLVLRHLGGIGRGSCTPEHWGRSYHLAFDSFVQESPLRVALVQHTETTRYYVMVPDVGSTLSECCPSREIYRLRVGEGYEAFVFAATFGLGGFHTPEQAREAVMHERLGPPHGWLVGRDRVPATMPSPDDDGPDSIFGEP